MGYRFAIEEKLPYTFLNNFRIKIISPITDSSYELKLYKSDIIKYSVVDPQPEVKLKYFYTFSRNSDIIKQLSNFLKKKIPFINKLDFTHTPFNISFNYVLNDQQILIYNEILKIFDISSANMAGATCYFKLDTGVGKTFILGKVIEYLKVPTIIVGPNKNANLAWDKMFNTASTVCDAGTEHKKIFGDYKKNIISDITFVTINYIIANPTIVKNIKLLILDEVHNYCTEARLKLFEKCNTLYMIACTATPQRRDNMNQCLTYFLGHLYDFNYFVKTRYFTNVHVIRYDSDNTIQYDETFNIHNIYKSLENDTKRNDIICNIVKNSKDNVFVFCEHIAHINILYDLLKKDVTDIVIIKYNSKEDNMINCDTHNKTIILTTYKMASESLSINDFFTIILGTPRKNNIPQIMGRIFRGNDLNITRNIYDIVDTNYRFFIRQFKERSEFYRSKNFFITNKIEYYL